ncbi:MAG: CpaE family protein [Terriglobales bacterium]
MSQLSVTILATDDEQRRILEIQVDATGVARTVNTFGALPLGSTDLILRRLQEVRTDVAIVDISRDTSAALRALELLQAEVPNTVLFAVGEVSRPQIIIAAMRAGAREFLEHPTSTNSLLDAFARLSSRRKRTPGAGRRGKLFTFVSAKGGSGATTIAVNTAVALQALQGKVALVDLARLGHAAIHLDVTPAFTVMDALKNVHRMDRSLLDGYTVHCSNGLHLLAGVSKPAPMDIPGNDYARLFDTLVDQYSCVVVDASSRVDPAIRTVCDLSHMVLLVAMVDFASLWSANHVREYLAAGVSEERIRLVLNRFHRTAGFTDAHIESAAHARILFKVPNQYAAIAAAIDRGTPVTQQHHSEIARAFKELAAKLASEHVGSRKEAPKAG